MQGTLKRAKMVRVYNTVQTLPRPPPAPEAENQAILHFETAACTNLPISSLACFFALSVILSRASSVPGEVCRGSNERRCPSFVGIVTKALVALVVVRVF